MPFSLILNSPTPFCLGARQTTGARKVTQIVTNVYAKRQVNVQRPQVVMPNAHIHLPPGLVAAAEAAAIHQEQFQ